MESGGRAAGPRPPDGRITARKRSRGDDRKGQRGPRSVDASLVTASAEDAYPSIGWPGARSPRRRRPRRAFGAVWSASMSLVEMTMRCRRTSGRLPTVARSTIAVDPPAGATSIQRIFPSANVSSERSSNPSVPWSGSQVRAACGVRTHVPLRGTRRDFSVSEDCCGSFPCGRLPRLRGRSHLVRPMVGRLSVVSEHGRRPGRRMRR